MNRPVLSGSENLETLVGRVKENLDAIQKSRRDSLIATEVPATIFHYTTDQGLFGILTSGKFWLTDALSLNDPTELRHGFDVALDILTQDTLGSPIKFVQDFVLTFNKTLSGKGRDFSRNFIASFSTDGDDLGQWRAYANNGRGYAIGFDGIAIERAFVGQKDGAARQSIPVMYSDTELQARARETIAVVHNAIVRVSQLSSVLRPSDSELDRCLKELSVFLAGEFITTATFFKHPAYKNESEYRFHEMFRVSAPVPGILRRPRRDSIVEYREFEWIKHAPASLKKIVIGPAAMPDKSREFVRECLNEARSKFPKSGVNDPVLEYSSIPYRAL